MTMVAKSAAPPWAIRVWYDGLNLMAELPGTSGGPPFIMRFPVTEAALSKCLNLLRVRYEDSPKASFASADVLVPKKVGAVKVEATPETRQAAWAALKKLGMV